MTTFDVQIGGKNYEIDAPDQATAIKALQGLSPQDAPQQPPAGADQDTMTYQGRQYTRSPDGSSWQLAQPAQPQGGSPLDSAVQGMTLGFGDEIAGGFGGIMDSLGFGPEGSKGTFSGGYNRTVDKARSNLAAYEKRDPLGSAASEVAGALLTVPVTGGLNVIRAPAVAAKTAPFLARIGNAALRGGANLGNAALTGAAYGAVQGVGSADGAPGDDLNVPGRLSAGAVGAGLGGILGAAVPVAGLAARGAGHLLGQPIEAAKAALRPDNAAARKVVEAASADAGSPAAATQALQDAQAGGAPMTPLDLGETSRDLARSAANVSPEARATMNQAIDQRFEAQTQRVEDTLSQVAPGVNAPATRDLLEKAAAASNKPRYAKAYLQGAGGIWHEGLEQLSLAPAMQTAMGDATKIVANKAAVQGFRPPVNPFVKQVDGTLRLPRGVKPTLQFWDATKQALDGQIAAAQRGGDKGHAADLTAIKRQLVSYLDEAVPSYKDARMGAAAYFGAENALDAGANFVRMAGDNAEARKAIGKMTPAERSLFGEGFATELVKQVRNISDRQSIVGRIFQSPAARERLEIALGAPAARKMEALMRVEAIMDLGRKAVQGNSSTVRQLIGQGLIGAGAGLYQGGFDPHNPETWITMALTTGALHGGQGLTKWASQGIDTDVAKKVAGMLVSQDPKIVEKALDLLGNNPVRMTWLRRGQDKLARMLVPAATGLAEGGQLVPMAIANGGAQPADASPQSPAR